VTHPRVSICLPTRNAEADLVRLLPALASQRVEGGCELVVIDSDSADGTREILRGAEAQLRRIPAETFRHGPTRNELAAMARGEHLVFLSQDVLPVGEDFIATLVAPMDDPAVAGVTARVLPYPTDDPLTARTVLAAAEARDVPSPLVAEGDGPRFNNVASAVRASVLERIPFPDLPFGEDLAWAEAVLASGEQLRFEPGAIVHHAHVYSPAAAFERYRIDAAFHRRTRGVRVRPNLVSVLRGVAYELFQDMRHIAAHGGWRHLARAPRLRVAQVLGQWYGSRGWRGRGGDEATHDFI
jgi:glycosyltransferase involved in cell wall biosynthesis